MTDVLLPVFVPYARFLESRARRSGIVTDLTPPDADPPINVAVSSAPVPGGEQAIAAVAVLATGPTPGAQRS